jgi:branched-chain amino acid transport system substrate-binding protein
MKKRLIVAALAAAFALAPLVGSTQANVPYKIGMTYPLTGPFGAFSTTYIAATQMGIDDVNSHGGVRGHKLQLLTEDSQGTPAAGIAAMRKLVQVDGVQAIITGFTNVVNAQLPLADELKVPIITPIETPGLLSKVAFTFAHAPTLTLVGPILQRYWKAHNVKSVYVVLSNNGFGHTIAPLIEQYITAAGAKYTEAFLNLNETDFRGAIERVKEAKPDAIYISLQGSSAEPLAVKQMRELDVAAPIFEGGNMFESKVYHDAIGPYVEGVFFTGLSMDKANSKSFVQAFKAKFGQPPSYQEGELYDIVHIFAWAIEKGGYSGDAIRNQISMLKGQVPSVLGGTITMGADHYSLTSGADIWQVRKGVEVKVGTR